MKLIKTTVLYLVMFSSFLISSCEKDTDDPKGISNKETLNAQKEVPTNTSPATGLVEYNYRKDIKTLSYTINWNGLTGPVSAMHIHGIADPGFNAGFLQNIITTSNGIATPGSRYGASGTITASLFIDGQVFKEEHLLAGKYYFNIHTATYPGGEIRAQITFP